MKTLIKRMLQPLRRNPALFYTIRLLHPRPGIYRHLYFTGEFRVDISGKEGFRLHHFGYQVENELFWAGYGHSYEGTSLRIWAELCREAQFIADVGANTGVYALAAGALNPAARIIALEPVPRIFDKLTANLSLNEFNITPMKVAASDTDGVAVLFDTAADHCYSASLDASMLEEFETIKTSVPSARLDTLFDRLEFPRIDLLKIDIERHEPQVLEGMKNRLRRDRPTLLIEILDAEIGKAIAGLLEELDYCFFAVQEGKGLAPSTRLGDGEARNYLVCQRSVWQGLELKLAGWTDYDADPRR